MSEGTKYDSKKPPMNLISRAAMEELAKVLGFGASKYQPENWRGGIAYSRIIAAAMRHLHAFNDGENKDPESGLSHVAHAMCNLMFLLEFEKYRIDLDDRYKRGIIVSKEKKE